MWFVLHIECLGLNTESEIAYSNTVFLLKPIILQSRLHHKPQQRRTILYNLKRLQNT